MIRCIIIFIFGVLTLNLSGQSDTTFISYPSPTNVNSFNSFILNSGSGYSVIMYNYDDEGAYSSILQTNMDGSLLNSMDSIIVNGTAITHVALFEETNNGYLLFASVEKDGEKNLFISFSISSDLANIAAIDTFALPFNDILLFSGSIKFNPTKDVFEGIGILNDMVFGTLTDNYYFSADKDGFFITNYSVEFHSSPKYITDFVWLPETNQYFIAFWDRTSQLLDDGLAPLDTIENDFTYQIGDTTFHDAFSLVCCDYGNGQITCSGLGSINRHYNFSYATLKVENGELIFNPPIPLLDQGNNDDLLFAKIVKDSEGNWILIGTGFFYTIGNTIEQNNIYIVKISPEGDIKWSTIFSNSDELSVDNAMTDINDDIVIIGTHKSQAFIGEYRNFLLKINSDGTLTGTNHIPPFSGFINIFPNPASGFLNIKSNYFDKKLKAHISSMDGKVLKSCEINNDTDPLYIGDLITGQYIVVFENKKGEFIPAEKFIKH